MLSVLSFNSWMSLSRFHIHTCTDSAVEGCVPLRKNRKIPISVLMQSTADSADRFCECEWTLRVFLLGRQLCHSQSLSLVANREAVLELLKAFGRLELVSRDVQGMQVLQMRQACLKWDDEWPDWSILHTLYIWKDWQHTNFTNRNLSHILTLSVNIIEFS